MDIKRTILDWMGLGSQHSSHAAETSHGLDSPDVKKVSHDVDRFRALYPKLFSQAFDPKKFEESARKLLDLGEAIQKNFHLMSKEEQDFVRKRFEVVAATLGKKRIRGDMSGQKLLEALNRFHKEHVDDIHDSIKVNKVSKEKVLELKKIVGEIRVQIKEHSFIEMPLVLRSDQEECNNLLYELPKLLPDSTFDSSFRKAMINSHIASLPNSQKELVQEVIECLRVAYEQNKDKDFQEFLKEWDPLTHIVGLKDPRDWSILIQR